MKWLGWHYSHTHIFTYMYLLYLLEVVGKRPHISELIFPSLGFLGSTVVQYTTFIFILSSRYISVGLSLVVFNPCLLMCRCPIVVFLDLSRFFLMSFSVIPGQVFRKTCLIALRRLAVVGMQSAACKYCARYGFEVCARVLFTTFSYCCVSRGTSHIPVFLFLVPLIIYDLFFWMDSSCLYSVMVHPSSHKTPNNINGAVCIFGKCGSFSLACLEQVAGVLLYVWTP